MIQSDDNIELDTGKLFRLLAEPGHSWGDLITCPTLTTGAKVGTADTTKPKFRFLKYLKFYH